MAREKPSTSAERRSYYRIDDDVFLEYRLIHRKQVQELLAGINQQATYGGLLGELNTLSRRTKSQLASIKKSHPVIARYLTTLDEKLDLIAQHVIAHEGSWGGRPNQRVNLSAGGMAFYAQQQIPAEALLAVSLKLFPSHREIVTYGPVVYCRFEPDIEPATPYRIGVQFSYMRDSDREALITHILERQFAAARSQRSMLTN